MDKDNWAVFRKFRFSKQANEYKELLEKNNIPTTVIDDSPILDGNYGSVIENNIQLMIYASNFPVAEKILDQEAENLALEIDESHYLFEFTNEELLEILTHKDEWSTLDYQLAIRVLKDRDKEIKPETLELMQQERVKELSKPEEVTDYWIYWGYLFAFLAGIGGVFVGWYLWNSKKTLPDGRKAYSYSLKDRKHGKIIFFISLIVFPPTLGFMLFDWDLFDFLLGLFSNYQTLSL